MTSRGIIATGIGLGLLALAGCGRAERRGVLPAVYTPGPAPAGGDRDDADSPTPPELTEASGLGDYLAYAAAHNPGLEAAFNRWKAAAERVPQVRALPDPKLSYRYYIREVETRVGAMRQGFGLSQTFPWLGKLDLRANAAAGEAEAQRRRFEVERLQLFYDVTHAWVEYAHLRRRIAIVRRNMDLVQHMEQVGRARYRAAAASHPDVIRAQLELGKLEDRLKALEALREPLAAELNAALNRPMDRELPWPEKIAYEPVSLDEQRLRARLGESNPELKALDARLAAAKRRTELARKAYYPDVTLGVDYTDVADSTGGRNPADDGEDAVAVMATINLPIWRDKLAAGVREAKRRQWAAARDRRQRANDLGARLSLALYHFRDAERKLNLYRETLVPKATEAFKTSESAFRAANADFTDVVDAQRVLLEFELAAERALADRAQRLAELEMLVGRELSGPAPAPASRPAIPNERPMEPMNDESPQ